MLLTFPGLQVAALHFNENATNHKENLKMERMEALDSGWCHIQQDRGAVAKEIREACSYLKRTRQSTINLLLIRLISNWS